MYSGFEYYEMTHKTLLSFVLASLPYIWLLAFVLMGGLAYLHMRKTKKGYKYPFWQIILGSLGLTIAGGLVLHSVGIGKVVDEVLGDRMPFYESADERQAYMWTHPEDGRITGVFIEQFGTSTVVRFRDAVDREWAVETRELMQEDFELLRSGKRVRLIGEVMSDADGNVFFSCSTLLWIPSDGYTLTSLQEQRENFQRHIDYFAQSQANNTAFSTTTRCHQVLSELMP